MCYGKAVVTKSRYNAVAEFFYCRRPVLLSINLGCSLSIIPSVADTMVPLSGTMVWVLFVSICYDVANLNISFVSYASFNNFSVILTNKIILVIFA